MSLALTDNSATPEKEDEGLEEEEEPKISTFEGSKMALSQVSASLAFSLPSSTLFLSSLSFFLYYLSSIMYLTTFGFYLARFWRRNAS